MRGLLLVLLVASAACAPEITSGAYICGPDSSCPENLVCNGPDNLCVLPSLVQPFTCETVSPMETDLGTLDCVSPRHESSGCMMTSDRIDTVVFAAPTTCSAAIEIDAGVSFPHAFAEVGLELWDADTGTHVATSGECAQGADTGEARRCLVQELIPGTHYRLEVVLTGEGTCDGACNYNRYLLRVGSGTVD